MINLLKKILLAFLLGFLSIFYVIQNHKNFKLIVQNKIEQLLKKSFECDFTFKIKRINLFSPFIELEEILVKENDNKEWKWTCKNLQFNCSWVDYILYGKFKANITMKKVDIFSALKDGTLSITPHLKKIILSNNPNVPLTVNEIKLKKSNLRIMENDFDISSSIDFNCEMKSINNYSNIIFYLTDGFVSKKNIICSNAISGTMQLNICQSNISKSIFEINGSANLPILKIEDNKCFFSGKWSENKKFLKIGTIDGKLNLECINFFIKNNTLNLDLIFQSSIQYLQKILNLNMNFPIDGNCILSLTTDIKKENLKGQCCINNISYKSNTTLIEELKLTFNKNAKTWCGILDITENQKNIFCGSWKIEELKKEIKLFYSGTLSKNEKVFESSGEVSISDSLKSKGNINKQFYELDLLLKPNLILRNFSYFNDEGKECIHINSDKTDILDSDIKISIYFENIQNWLSEMFSENLIGQGEVFINGHFIQNKFIGRIRSNNLNIIISKVYNIIKEIKGDLEIDIFNKMITLNNTIFKLYKGYIECNNAKILFDNFVPNFIDIPLTIKDGLLSWKNDVIADLSGNILIKKSSNLPINIIGSLFINNAQISNNIFSDDFKNELLNKYDMSNKNQSNINLDLSITSEDTIKVKTPFLNTKLKLDLKLLNNISLPKISGTIDLTKGSIAFPYRKLNITSGNISFLPDETNELFINLTAKNKIKGYNIIMNATGSLQNPNIKFESSPPLSDEQIIALLLVGNEKGSFNMIMPTLVMKNIKNIIFGSSATHKNIKHYFDKLLKPLKFIKIVPNYNSETGRPGFKGSINILNDRLRVELQKNFTLAEDTRFDINYAITDEIKLKATKDERGDLGGEIEMRWKF